MPRRQHEVADGMSRLRNETGLEDIDDDIPLFVTVREEYDDKDPPLQMGLFSHTLEVIALEDEPREEIDVCPSLSKSFYDNRAMMRCAEHEQFGLRLRAFSSTNYPLNYRPN